MKSSLRRIRNLAKGPPIPLTPKYRQGGANIFNLGVGKLSREQQLRSYGMSGTVFSIVSLLQEASASANWRMFKQQPQDGRRRFSTADHGSDQRIEVVQHAALSLWKYPNQFMDGFTFREGANQHLELTGETIWVLNNEGTTFPTAMWYVRPDRMEPVPSPEDYLVGWIYTADSGENIPLKVDEVIIEKRPDPLDPLRGMGPVAALMPNIQQQRYATEFQRNLFLNGADPGGVITVPTKLSDPDFDQLVDRWREGHQGISRAGRVGILENGATFNPSSQSNKDLEYGNLRLANRDELREGWRMHKSMLGTVEDVNRANAQTAEEVFSGWMIEPRLVRRRSTLNFKLLPKFGPSDNKIYEFDFDDQSPDDREADGQELLAKSQAAQRLVAAGYDPEDVCEVVGLPSMDFVGATIGSLSGPEQAPPEGPEAAEQAEGQLSNRETITLRAIAKVSKSSVNYRTAESQARSCATCAMFNSESGRCDLVSGKIQPYDVCDRWIDSYANRLPKAIRAKRDPQAKVLQQLSRDYPPEAMAWAHHADWSGPVTLPCDHFEPDMKWLDLASPQHVADFIEKIQSGKKLKPVIAVKTPESKKPKLIDGHHRYLADEQMHEPVRAYIATVDTEHGPWETMHDYQLGSQPHNRFGDLDPAAVAYLKHLIGVNGHEFVKGGADAP